MPPTPPAEPSLPPGVAGPAVDGDRGDDDRIVEDFLPPAIDLLRPYFNDEADLRAGLTVVVEALRSDQGLWESAGRQAFRALAQGMRGADGEEGARKWAELVEPLFRRLCSMVSEIDGERQDGDGLGKLVRVAKVLTSRSLDSRKSYIREMREKLEALFRTAGLDVPQKSMEALVPALLGAARMHGPTSSGAHELSCLSAVEFRNRNAHGNWSAIGWRARMEIAETVLLTLLRIVEKYPVIECSIVFQQAREKLPKIDGPKVDFPWSWSLVGTTGMEDSAALARSILELIKPEKSRLVIHGPRGVGLSQLGERLSALSVSADGGEKIVLAIGRPGSAYTMRSGHPADAPSLSDDDFMVELLGDCWCSWWMRTALDKGWLGIVLDGLEQLDGPALRNFVLRFEAIFRKWRPLRLVTLRPDVLPVGVSSEPPNILGILGKGEALHVEGRRHPPISSENFPPLGHPATLAYWLDRGAATLGEREPTDAVLTLIEQELAYDHEERWPNFNPAWRKAAAVVALNALYWFVEVLDDVPSAGEESPVPRLEREQYNQVLIRAFNDVRNDFAGKGAGTDKVNGLIEAVDAALTQADLLRSRDRDGPVWLAHPLIEEHAWTDGYRAWVRQKWAALSSSEQAAVAEAAKDF